MSQVKVSQQGALGELLLDNPSTLNALTLSDIQALHTGLHEHEANPDVKAIVIRSSSSKAFCAGGDMKHIRTQAMQGNVESIESFFREEYALNLAIARCSKPYIALMDGIAMGGGLGVSVHGSVRVVTERSLLAMPETRIGFFPDVGASYFLPRLHHGAGIWLGLTSMAVRGHEAVDVGLATHYVKSDQLNSLWEALNAALERTSDEQPEAWHNCAATVLNTYREPAPENTFQDTLRKRQQWFSSNSLAGILAELERASDSGDEDAGQLLALLKSGSPHALSITLELLEATQGKTLEQCLSAEWVLAQKTAAHADCIEGIRAVLVDKDRQPVWQ